MLEKISSALPEKADWKSRASDGLLLALAYFVAELITIRWIQVEGAGSPLWPAFGIGLAALLLQGARFWPAIVVGHVLTAAFAPTRNSLPAELAVAMGNSMGIAMAVAGLERLGGLEKRLMRMIDIGRLAGVVVVAGALSAGWGTIVRYLLEPPPIGVAMFGTSWFLSNIVAGVTVTPLILTLASPWHRQAIRRAPVLAVLCFVAIALASGVIFLIGGNAALRAWDVYPLLIAAALLLGAGGAAIGLLVVTCAAVGALVLGIGPFEVITDDPVVAVLIVQQFLVVTALTMLLLAAIADERRGKLVIAAKNVELEGAMYQLATAEAAEEVLTYEINHRVKNSLQLIASILWLQSRHTAIPEARRSLEEARRRIGIVAAIHQELYAQGSHNKVRVGKVLRSLANDAQRADDARPEIEWQVEIEDVELPINHAVALALIANELLRNTVKFAFPAEVRGLIEISLSQADGMIAFRLSDDGQALPEDFELAGTSGVGLRIVRALIDQVDARLHFVRREQGTLFELVFAQPA